MRKVLPALGAMSLLLISSLGNAEPEQPRAYGLSLGLRVGYAVPVGSVASAIPMPHRFSGALPITIDLGYRLASHWYVGAFGTFAYDIVKKGASVDNGQVVCTASGCPTMYQFHAGLNGRYHFLPTKRWDPYVGLGVGYELSKQSDVGPDRLLRGFEYGELQTGLDIRLVPWFRFGPIASFAIGQYDTQAKFTREDTGAVVGGSLPSGRRTLHGWLNFGVRGQFDM